MNMNKKIKVVRVKRNEGGDVIIINECDFDAGLYTACPLDPVIEADKEAKEARALAVEAAEKADRVREVTAKAKADKELREMQRVAAEDAARDAKEDVAAKAKADKELAKAKEAPQGRNRAQAKE